MIDEKIIVTKENIIEYNLMLRSMSPKQIVEWAINIADKAIVTTNFRPYEAAILHVCSAVKSDIDVIWCDTGYNTPNTYRNALETIKQLNLNIDLYVPKQSVAYRDVVLGIPSVTDEKHKEFTQQVKLEPFKRAMNNHGPDVWFTNLRKGQTALRDNLDILSLDSKGVLKVSPFYYYSDAELDDYMQEHELLNEFKYYDPTKGLENRECGLHTN
jgi:phosphoadenosine phosphosulfate reductase